jgi:hypothetical protein
LNASGSGIDYMAVVDNCASPVFEEIEVALLLVGSTLAVVLLIGSTSLEWSHKSSHSGQRGYRRRLPILCV